MRKILFLTLLVGLALHSFQASAFDDAQAHATVLQGTPQDVYKLVKSGYDVNRVYQCQTLLTTAIKSMAENLAVNDHPEDTVKKITILLNNGANYNQEPCHGKSLRPIFWAVTLPLILQETEQELNAVLDENIRQGTEYCDIPNIISKQCKDITSEEREQIRNYFAQTTKESIRRLNPHFATIIKLLVRRGVKLDSTDERGQTVLHYAAAMPKEITSEPLKLLLEHGMFVDPLTPEKQTPLFFAYGAHNPEAVNLLLDAGADPTMRDINGILPNKSKNVLLERTSHQDTSISIRLEN